MTTAKPFSDVTAASDPIRINEALLSALTAYDIRQSTRKGYNMYALPQYMNALDNAIVAIQSGKTLRQALVSSFCGRLLDVMLKAVQEAPSTDSEQRY